MNNKSFLRKIIDSPLHWQIFAAMILGAALGLGLKYGFAGAASPGWADTIVAIGDFLGKIFIRLLKMMIVPLVATSIIVGVAGAGDSRNLGRIGLKTFGYYMLTSMLAILIGLSLSNLVRPGQGVTLPGGSAFSADSLEKPGSLWDILLRMIPNNPAESLVKMDMLQIIFFAILTGVFLTRMPIKMRDSVLVPIDALFQTFMKLTEFIIRFAPIGVFGLILVTTNTLNDDYFRAIATYMMTIAVGLTLHTFLVLPLIYLILTRRNPIRHFRHMTNAMLTAFSTSSSSATLPVTMECVEKNAGVSNRISSFVLPLGATVNMDGTALYECAGVLFIAQVLGVDLTFVQQVVVVLTALLASIGAAGIPSAGLVMIFIVLHAVGLDNESSALVVGTMLAVDRPLDMYRTLVNIFSDSVGAVVIAHSEGELNDPAEADVA